MINAANLRGFVNLPLRNMLAEKNGLRLVFNNDGNVGALGEFRFGAGQGLRDIKRNWGATRE